MSMAADAPEVRAPTPIAPARAVVARATANSSIESLDRLLRTHSARFEPAAASLPNIPAPLIVKRAEVCVVNAERDDT